MAKELTRERLQRLVDEGLLDAKAVLELFIRWNTNADIEDMLRCEDIDIDSTMFD